MGHGERVLLASREVASLRAAIVADPLLLRWNRALKQWQAGRLASTHADLLASARFHDAARFFLEDLYGTKDFSRRDTELGRVLPVLARTLPDAALATLADAIELDALSEALDDSLARRLRRETADSIDADSYADAYRGGSTRAERERQLELVRHIGTSLDRLVRHPTIGALLRATGPAARIGGFGAIHDFLADGYRAFRRIGGASEFLGRIDRRERAIMERLFGGAPDPFAPVPESC